ncbi:MAG: enoyl-CoA hydratase/isomerase family protein [Alphaproteobacteria bacterium]|nr:enoyl-CoA hydratase/isomerase family protein [Alphaproteobacteria bacterium]
MNPSDLAPWEAARHPLIDSEFQAGVLVLRMRSAGDIGWDLDFVETLAYIFQELPTCAQVRVVVLRGEPDFGLGLDLAHFQHMLTEQAVRTRQALQRIRRWREHTCRVLPQAVISVVDGRCRGTALDLVHASDIALAADTARFQAPASTADGLDLLLDPHTHDAAHALSQGWVSFCHPVEGLDPALQELLASLMAKDPLALQFTKETLAMVGDMGWDVSVSFTAAKFAEIKARQAEQGGPSTRSNAIAGFLSGQSKPGLKG